MRAVNGRALFAHTDVQLAAFTQTADQLQVDCRPATGWLAINGNNFLASCEPGHFGDTPRLDRTDDRTHLLGADHGQDPEEEKRQEKVGHRARGNNRDALAHGLAVERLLDLIARHLAFALVEHLHVAAQRNGRHHELRAMAVMPAQQRHAETDGETQNLDAATPGHPEVTEFVKGDQHTQCHQGADNHVERTHVFLRMTFSGTGPDALMRQASATVMSQPLSGQLPRTLISGKHRIKRLDGNHRLLIEHLFDHTRDLREADTPLEKCLHRHFVGRVEHGRRAVTRLGRLTGQAQARETLLVRRLEVQPGNREQVQWRHA
ncbi:hypothetical protein D3C80_1029940 [compost metagenome]